MRRKAQTRNPLSRTMSGEWIPGSLALLAPRNDEGRSISERSPDERSEILVFPLIVAPHVASLMRATWRRRIRLCSSDVAIQKGPPTACRQKPVWYRLAV